jgi:hypothetical protein
VFACHAAAVGVKSQEQGVERLKLSHCELLHRAEQIIQQAQDMTHFLMGKGFYQPAPKERA